MPKNNIHFQADEKSSQQAGRTRTLASMAPVQEDLAVLSKDVLRALDDIGGLHAGFRPAHAKGILLSGTFTPAASAVSLTRAPHVKRDSTPISVRFSNSSGIPAIPDNDPNASPRGIAIRFHLAEHSHTDIIAHSVNAFPARTPEEFLELLRAAGASGPDAPKPSPIEVFLGSHPAALRFVQLAKPTPSSFSKGAYFGVTAHKFTNMNDVARHGRYRIVPETLTDYLDAAKLSAKPPDFLFDEIKERVTGGPIKMRVVVQLAESGDVVDDATVQWPEERSQVDFGVIELSSVTPNNEAEQRHIIFDPIARVDGIDPSNDPLLEARAAVYLMSGRRRRSAAATA